MSSIPKFLEEIIEKIDEAIYFNTSDDTSNLENPKLYYYNTVQSIKEKAYNFWRSIKPVVDLSNEELLIKYSEVVQDNENIKSKLKKAEDMQVVPKTEHYRLRRQLIDCVDLTAGQKEEIFYLKLFLKEEKEAHNLLKIEYRKLQTELQNLSPGVQIKNKKPSDLLPEDLTRKMLIKKIDRVKIKLEDLIMFNKNATLLQRNELKNKFENKINECINILNR